MSISTIIEFLASGRCTFDYATAMSCMTDDLVALNYLYEKKYPLTTDTFYMCVKHNSINCLDFLIKHKCPFATNSYIAAFDNIIIFKKLKNLYDLYDDFGYDHEIPDIYDTELLKLIIQLDDLDVLKCYNSNDAEFDYGELLEIILKFKRADILDWCYENNNDNETFIATELFYAFPLVNISEYNYINDGLDDLGFFINWVQAKNTPDLKLITYTELFKRSYQYIDIADIMYTCGILIDDELQNLDLLELHDQTFINCYPTLSVGFNKMVEWVINHGVDVELLTLIMWSSNNTCYPWIGFVCKKDETKISIIVDYCIDFNNVHLLAYLHSINVPIPNDICEKSAMKKSINCLNWGLFNMFRCDVQKYHQ